MWNSFWKRALLFVCILALAVSGLSFGTMFCSSMASLAAERRVYDDAALFSKEETEELEAQIAAVRKEVGMELAVVTVNQTNGLSSEQYADDFYDYGDFGSREDMSGALFLIDMDNRNIYLSTTGDMIPFVTDGRREELLNNAFGYISSGDYAGAAGSAIRDLETFYEEGIPGGQYLFDRDTGKIIRRRSIRWYEFLLAFAVAAFCGGGAVLSVKREYAMKQEKKLASGFHNAYQADAAFAYRLRNDNLLNSFVTQRIIPKSPPSSGGGHSGGRTTVHRSGSGRSHGGGGRSF